MAGEPRKHTTTNPRTIDLTESAIDALRQLRARGIKQRHFASRAIEFLASLTERGQDIILRGIKDSEDAEMLAREIRRLGETNSGTASSQIVIVETDEKGQKRRGKL